ncbi:MAG: trigger factor [Hyphomicrobiaceae bacterium]
MQVTETSSEGLKRKLKITVGAAELAERFATRLNEVKDEVQLKGFRKGKVPVAHLKKLFGRDLMREVLQQTIEETSRKVIADRKERTALDPDIEFGKDQEHLDRLIAGTTDFTYDISFEALPEIVLADFSTLKLERLTADIDVAAVDQALDRLAQQNTHYHAEADRMAQKADRLTIDFNGTVDGEAFTGGTGQDVQLVLGQGHFLPSFEAGLEGGKAGERRTFNVQFPADYGVKTLVGKTAVFDAAIKEVAHSHKPALDDEFAKTFGLQTMANLRETMTARLASEYAAMSRQKLKRALFDQIDESYRFDLPTSLLQREFDHIWQSLTEDMKRTGRTFADLSKTEDELRAQYRRIAERRVRVGLTVNEIGQKNDIQVSQDEIKRALIARVQQYAGQEKAVYDYYERTPSALAEIRAPIFEEKVVDLILENVKPPVRKVSREDLFATDPDEL